MSSTTAPSEFVSRFQAAQRLGKHARTVADNETRWDLVPVRVNGQVSYTAESVDALAARWRAKAEREAANRTVIVPTGWRLLIANARGPFIGEFFPEAPALAKLIGRIPELQQFPAISRCRRCVVSYDLVAVAFQVADAEGLNIISNERGIVAVRES